MFRRKCRDSLKLKLVLCRREGVPDRENAGIKDTNNISRICFFYHFTLVCHHLLRLGKLDLFVSLHMEYFHARRKLTGTDTHKRNTVPVIFIHICLNLKDKRRKIFLKRINHSDV